MIRFSLATLCGNDHHLNGNLPALKKIKSNLQCYVFYFLTNIPENLILNFTFS